MWAISRKTRLENVMTLRVLLIAAFLGFPFHVFAGPKEDAQAVFDKFLTNYTAADFDGVVALFWPDALVWGTQMPNLATTPEAVREYFKPLSSRQPNERKATLAGAPAVLVVSDSAVLISGLWQSESVVDGKPVVSAPLRVSVAVTKRGDRWSMSQFHNSPRPKTQ
jgi:uncharacterized protein (TIGR02246 family)